MTAILTQKIPQQNFELIGARIFEILRDEIAAQALIAPVTPELNATVFHERFVPFDKTDMPCVDVIFSNGTYDNQNTKTADGVYKYFIDVYCKSKTVGTDRGDKLASLQLHRILGICRAILESPQYRTLAFAAPSIQNTTVVDVAIEQPNNTQDAQSVIMGRLTFDVSVCESVQLLTANNIAGWETSVEMDESGSGYQFSNTPIP